MKTWVIRFLLPQRAWLLLFLVVLVLMVERHGLITSAMLNMSMITLSRDATDTEFWSERPFWIDWATAQAATDAHSARVVARIWDRVGYPERAIGILEQVPPPERDALLIWYQAQFYARLGRVDDAVQLLVGLKLPVDGLVAWAKQAEQKGDPALAAVLFRAASQGDSESWVTWRSLGLWWLQQGDLDKAVFYLQKTQDKVPQDHYTYYLLGLAYRGQGQFDQSILAWHRALELVPNHPTYTREMARTLLSRGRPGDRERAIDLLTNLVARNPGDMHAKELLDTVVGGR